MYTYSEFVDKVIFPKVTSDNKRALIHILLSKDLKRTNVGIANDVTYSLAMAMALDYNKYCSDHGIFDREEKFGVTYFDFLYSIAYTYEMIEPIRHYNTSSKAYKLSEITVRDIFWLILDFLGINVSEDGLSKIDNLDFSSDIINEGINLSLEERITNYYTNKLKELMKKYKDTNTPISRNRRYFSLGV